jgi:hypothetical protein
MPPEKKDHVLASRCTSVTVPELEQSKAAVLSTLASTHLSGTCALLRGVTSIFSARPCSPLHISVKSRMSSSES